MLREPGVPSSSPYLKRLPRPPLPAGSKRHHIVSTSDGYATKSCALNKNRFLLFRNIIEKKFFKNRPRLPLSMSGSPSRSCKRGCREEYHKILKINPSMYKPPKTLNAKTLGNRPQMQSKTKHPNFAGVIKYLFYNKSLCNSPGFDFHFYTAVDISNWITFLK